MQHIHVGANMNKWMSGYVHGVEMGPSSYNLSVSVITDLRIRSRLRTSSATTYGSTQTKSIN